MAEPHNYRTKKILNYNTTKVRNYKGISVQTALLPGHSALDDLALNFLRECLAGLQVLLEFDRGVPFANLRQKSHEKPKR